eukprot:CAMPEP_0197481014 /NCGR_PEP_ID=MMETSP1309-20131121/44665_1 /TAXON_ID=464262 /ORGANISM="Genus nov. species nov., Strain RCC998" /LENGTH=134 /DNA_ID=CAMNT_0043023133 /DNA_START=327 /DNA_END=731 /DNA_ORIENTATION=-
MSSAFILLTSSFPFAASSTVSKSPARILSSASWSLAASFTCAFCCSTAFPTIFLTPSAAEKHSPPHSAMTPTSSNTLPVSTSSTASPPAPTSPPSKALATLVVLAGGLRLAARDDVVEKTEEEVEEVEVEVPGN